MTENQTTHLAELGQVLLEALHEMSNPLAGLSMGVQLLEMSDATMRQALTTEPIDREMLLGLLDRNQEQLARMTHAIEMLAKLRKDLADYGKPVSLNLAPRRFRDVIEQSLDSFMPQPRFEGLQMESSLLADSPMVRCQPDSLEQVLFNVLKNAAEATEGRGRVWLTERQEGDRVILEIEDNGPGVAEDIRSRLFTPFLTSKPATGSGLGLSIARRIIHQHGGDISVYNKPERGACFKITLPVVNREA